MNLQPPTCKSLERGAIGVSQQQDVLRRPKGLYNIAVTSKHSIHQMTKATPHALVKLNCIPAVLGVINETQLRSVKCMLNGLPQKQSIADMVDITETQRILHKDSPG